MCRARLGCSAPKRFRGMQRTARTEQPPPSSRARTARHPEDQRCAPQRSRRGWLRSLARPRSGKARRARRIQGASHRFADSSRSRPKQARPRSLLSTNQSNAATRFNRTDCGHAPISKQAVVGVVAASGNGRAVGSIGMRRHRQRASHHAVISGTLLRQNCARFAPHAEGCWPLRRHKKVNSSAAAPTRDPRFKDFSLCVSVMPPLLRASSRRRLTSVGNPRVSSLRR